MSFDYGPVIQIRIVTKEYFGASVDVTSGLTSFAVARQNFVWKLGVGNT
jgi:hypothetical protein